MADVVQAVAVPAAMLVLFVAANGALALFFDVDMRRKRRRTK